MEELARLLGLGDVTFHFQDDKAKMLMGTASKQFLFPMYMEYKDTLPYYDYTSK